MNDDLIRQLRAEGHHTEADQIERREILGELRAGGRHDLARALERNAGRGPIGPDGSIDVDALQDQRSRDLEALGRMAQNQANGGYTAPTTSAACSTR